MLQPDCGARRIAASTAVALGLAAGLLDAQQSTQVPSRQPTFRSGVELVQIDVVVTDERGTHIRGLTASDFEIFDPGKPQVVAAFEEVTHQRADMVARGRMLPLAVRAAVATNQTVQSNRLVVMAIDDLHIWHERTDKAKDIARQVLARLGAEATMAVLFTSGEGGTEPTVDRAALSAAVETMKGRQSIQRPNAAPDKPDVLRELFDNMAQYRTLEDAARLLGAADMRRKAFVMLSEGISKDLTGVFDSAVGPCEARSRSTCYHELALRAIMESLRRSNVVTYTIDPRGQVTSQELAFESSGKPGAGGGEPFRWQDDPIFRWHNPVRMAQDGLAVMAEASGGFAVVDTDDFSSGLDRIIADLDHYYLIGFYPAEKDGKGYRPLDVRVPAHPAWTIRFRKGYRPAGTPKEKRTDADDSPLTTLSTGVLPVSDLALALTAIPLASRDAKAALEGTLAIVAEDGETVLESIPFVPGADGRVDLRVPLEALTPGPYILRASVANGERSATREIGFAIR